MLTRFLNYCKKWHAKCTDSELCDLILEKIREIKRDTSFINNIITVKLNFPTLTNLNYIEHKKYYLKLY